MYVCRSKNTVHTTMQENQCSLRFLEMGQNMQYTVDLENFGVKKLRKAHTYFNKIKTHEIFLLWVCMWSTLYLWLDLDRSCVWADLLVCKILGIGKWKIMLNKCTELLRLKKDCCHYASQARIYVTTYSLWCTYRLYIDNVMYIIFATVAHMCKFNFV